MRGPVEGTVRWGDSRRDCRLYELSLMEQCLAGSFRSRSLRIYKLWKHGWTTRRPVNTHSNSMQVHRLGSGVRSLHRLNQNHSC